MKIEEWLPIPNYDGFYEISNSGKVRSLDRTIYFKNNKGSRTYIGKILKLKYHDGYAMVTLNKNKNIESLYVDRLVALMFVPNPWNKSDVKHIDGIKSNNNYLNLEWCTKLENNEHVIKIELIVPNISGRLQSNVNNMKQIAILKSGKILAIKDCSRNAATWMLQSKYFKNVSIETAARAIRQSANSGKPYHGYNFQFI